MGESVKFRNPTPEQMSQERTIIYASIADSLIVTAQVTVGLTSGSLTMLGDSVRASFMLIVEYYSLWILRGIHRNRFHRYEFGIGKLEQFIVMIVGVMITLVGLWFLNTTVTRLFNTDVAPSPLGLAAAAIVNGINFMINLFALYAMLQNEEKNESDIYRAQVKSRSIKLINSLVLQITLTIAALATDPLIALVMDTAGAGFVSCFMTFNGVRMTARSVPQLLDTPLPSQKLEKIIETAKGACDLAVDIKAVRSRQSGRNDHVEIAVAMASHLSADQFRAQLIRISDAVKGGNGEIDLSIVVTEESPTT
ncbi:cation transporter [Sneathiella sp.]|uniref:cation diffusion facilitator family transporter n=1 Tax=Sneathiella sp. TaxID=1964365 RepID=UPI00260D372B|nr:cation transporter [Sneathiella sp.]MDF2367848.1 cation transporter [Sneathiella sp.]